ncbi:MAG: glucosaminidase domain-containing protein [Roseiflexus sp.]|nr:glucosaminidase domain-containing protein [Roseiflexus sp.]MBO9342297.1 glucosaminidase domain-containing protein [Roseiflexus sp.]MBO9366640.1 glucosaminidase domain-containing protein [Roseiflexus sp.]MBO9384035.1 glucosaminidase domain-containing protein [Roseiflexus sp.]MBO9390695.1 glucosaminidase domain-containing protein [Roseiflexus sp.]
MFSENTPILGRPTASVAQIAAFILARPRGEYTTRDIEAVIVPVYWQLCAEIGIDPTLAVAQMIHETGNLTSFWAARPQRNPAGIGVTGQKQTTPPPDTNGWAFNSQRQQWEAGVSFATWEHDAIPAHVGRLLAYALPIGAENPVQRAAIERALRYRALPARMRGSAPTLKQLGRVHNPTGQGWASPGIDYGAKIAAIATRIVTGR